MFPLSKGLQLTFPKMHDNLYNLPRYLKKRRHSLQQVNEQGGEAVHVDYLDFERNYKIPTPIPLIKPKTSHSSSSSSSSSDPLHPSQGTRSGAQKETQRKQAAKQFKAFLRSFAEIPVTPPEDEAEISKKRKEPPSRGKVAPRLRKKAQMSRRQCLAAYNAQKFPPECDHRKELVAAHQSSVPPWKKSCFD